MLLWRENTILMERPLSSFSSAFTLLSFDFYKHLLMSISPFDDVPQIDPKRAIPRTEGAKTDKLFVRSIPNSCTQESFRAYWREFGLITDATLMMDKESGRHRGFGFVNYENLEAVEKVLSTGPHLMDGQVVSFFFSFCFGRST